MRFVHPSVAVLLLVGAPALAAAQGSPTEFGAPGPAEKHRAYQHYTLGEVNTVLAQRAAAWRNGDVGEVLERYSEEAFLYPADGGEVQGESEIRRYLEDRIDRHLDLDATTLEFRTSGDLAYVVQHVTYRVEGVSGGVRETETVAFVLRREWPHGWRIVSQVSRGSAR